MRYVARTFRALEPFFGVGSDAQRATMLALRAARVPVEPQFYIVGSFVSGILAGAAAGVVAFLVVGAFFEVPWALVTMLAVATGLTVTLLVRIGFLLYPRALAATRAAKIDAEYPTVVVLCYALASGGMSMTQVFRTVAEERATYGEISREFEHVLKNVEWLGLDINRALEDAAATTPSRLLAAFFRGLVTILNSGAEPVDFFRRQAETQLSEAEVRLEQELDRAGMLAETYVSGLLVLPLLLLVLLTLLSTLSGGGGGGVTLVVYLMIPLGTACYLLLLEILLPSEPFRTPTPPPMPFIDCGLDGYAASARAVPMGPDPPPPVGPDAPTRRRIRFELARQDIARRFRRLSGRALEQPSATLGSSVGIATVMVAIGFLLLWLSGERGGDLVVSGTGLALAGALVVGLPVAIFHEARVRRSNAIERQLPEVLSKLTSFNERGISIVRSFEIIGRATTGPLAQELRYVERDVSWNANLSGALARMRGRATTPRVSKLALLFERAAAATGNLRDVMEIAAREATKTEAVRARKRASMLSYVVVIYVVFAVFLYVVYVTTDLFFGSGGFATVAGGKAGGGIPVEEARLLFFHAVLLQGVCCGLVAGKLGEGQVLSGVKHAAVLAAIAWMVFRWGVLA